MALYLNTNIASLFAARSLNNITQSINTSYKRLSSGLRINSAKDDPSGLAISNRFTSEINGLSQGNRNASYGIALAQTAEGAVDEITTMLQRVRILALQSANGTYTENDRLSLQEEVQSLCAEITRISCKTTFAGEKILAGANQGLVDGDNKVKIQVGAYANDTVDIDLSQGYSLAKLFSRATGSELKIVGADTAENLGLKLDKEIGNGEICFSVSSQKSAQSTLNILDKFINTVDLGRGRLGAVQNRFESIIRNQGNIIENLSDARSRIRDADYAFETANLASLSIRQQASVAMLTYANKQGNLILSLLQNL